MILLNLKFISAIGDRTVESIEKRNATARTPYIQGLPEGLKRIGDRYGHFHQKPNQKIAIKI